MNTDVLPLPYIPGDEEGIVKLFRICFSETRDMSEWIWRYRSNPAGQPAIMVAEAAGEIVGHLAYQPRRYWVDGSERIGGLDSDLMVLPDYRGGHHSVRLSTRLVYGLRAEASEGPYDFVYAAANDRSLGMARNPVFGLTKVKEIPQLVKLLDPSCLLRGVAGRVLRRVGRGLSVPRWRRRPCPGVSELAHLDDRLERLWVSARSDYRVIGVRDLEYMRWRYGGPTCGIDRGAQEDRYRLYVKEGPSGIDGYAVVRSVREGGSHVAYLVDLLTRRDDVSTVRLLGQAVIAHCRVSGAGVIRGWMPEEVPAHRVLCDLGFRPRTVKWGWWVRPVKKVPHTDPLLDPKAWYFTLGDCDGI